MTPDDVKGFYARRGELAAEDYIELDFTFECAGDPREAAAHLCSEQSTAQWRRVGVDEDFRPRFGAKVLEIEVRAAPLGLQHSGRVRRQGAGPRGARDHRASARQFRPAHPEPALGGLRRGRVLLARHSADPP